MQVLNLTASITTPQAVYLPADRAPVPFGDPFAASVVLGTPAIFASPVVIASGSAVSFSVAGNNNFLSSLAGLTSIQAQLNTVYYVVGTSVATTGGAVEPFFYQFNISTTVGGVAPATLQASITTLAGGNAVAGQVFVHLLSSQSDGTILPFKPNNTVLAWNTGFVSATGVNASQSITLMGAPDQNTTLATGTYGAPLGAAPSAWKVIATLAYGAPVLVQLGFDWICASGATGNLVLMQN
jgi:hypothetical protein